MGEQIKNIDKYYTDLKYNINKAAAKAIIKAYIEILQSKNIENLSERFFETASFIEENFETFVAVCEHVDVVTALIEYLNYYGAKILFELNELSTGYKNKFICATLIFTVSTMCEEEVIISFLNHAVLYDLEKSLGTTFDINYKFYHDSITMSMRNIFNHVSEMIILEDSDLYAVINCLMKIGNSSLNKIWIQKSIIQEFLMFEKKYLNYSIKCPIDIFQSQQELLTISTFGNYMMSTISIWSEDIIAAKNLASSFNNDIVFINTHKDFTGGLLFLPFAKIFDNLITHETMNNMDKTNVHENNILPSTNNILKYSSEYKNYLKIIHLFYDGMWQNPVQNSYFKHEDQLFANATNEDIKRCIQSAKKGFKIWDANSIISRKEILSNFTFALSDNCEPTSSSLSSLIERCTKFITFYENSNGYCTQNLELINSSKAKGIIILREKNETTLILRLTQCLLAGNSVIVICNEKFCNIKPYLNIFSMCDIPPGVLNMLSSECIENLESRLCGKKYSDYAKQYFISEGSIFEKHKNYTNLYLEKQIAHILK